MAKNKLIQVRLNDSQFKFITEKAESKNQSTSEYIREILIHPEMNISNEKTDTENNTNIPVFQRPEFIKVVVWIYSKKNNLNKGNSIDEANLFRSLIDSFIMDLEPAYLEYFFNVKKDLNRVIKEYSPLYGVVYNFDKSYNQVYFNFDEFEKMLLGDLM